MSSKSQSQTRYFLFNRNTLQKTGEYKVVKNAATREEARDSRRSSVQNLGIYDRVLRTVIS